MVDSPHPRRWGMTVPLNDGPLHAQRSQIEQLEAAGYTDLWSAEAMGVDGLSPLLLGSQWAPSMRLGTAILPAFTRGLSLIHISEPTRPLYISYAVFCLKKKK